MVTIGGALQHRAGVIEVILGHPGQVRMSGARPGERLVPGLFAHVTGAGVDLERGRWYRVRGHHLLPLRPLGVTDLDRHRAPHGQPVPDTAEQPDVVLLELHPGPASVAEAAASQGVGHLLGSDLHTGRQALQHPEHCLAVGLPCRQPSEHELILARGGPASRRRPGVRRLIPAAAAPRPRNMPHRPPAKVRRRPQCADRPGG